MLFDSINLKEGSQINNATIDSGTSFPSSPSIAELFFRTDNPNEGLYVYDGTVWSLVGQGGTVDLDGLNVKAAARAATTTNITLTGLQTIDGVALFNGDRVLVKNQSTASQNGIYEASSSSWVRTSDFDGSPANEVKAGDFVFVTEGTTQGDTGWVLTTNGAITIGTTALTFSQFTGTNASPGGTTGQLQYNNAGVFAGVSSGTSGQVLVSGGAGSPPSWQTVVSTSTTSTNIAGGTAQQIPFQSAPSVTSFSNGLRWNNGGFNDDRLTLGRAGNGVVTLFFDDAAVIRNRDAQSTMSVGPGPIVTSNDATTIPTTFHAGDNNFGRRAGHALFRGGDATAGTISEAGDATLRGGNNNGPLGAGWVYIQGGVNSGAGAHGAISFSTAGTERLTIGTTGSLTMTGIGQSTRFRADFSSGSSTRTFFTTTVTDSNTNVGFIPNGTATRANIAVFNTSTLLSGTNYGQFIAETGQVRIDSGTITGANVPITFSFQNVEAARLSNTGAWSFGSSGTAFGSSGQVLTSNGSGSAPSWQVNKPTQLPRATSFTQTLADRGNRIVISAGVTLPSGVYSGGDAFSFYNSSASPVTITQGSGLTLRQDGTANTGNRTLAAYGTCFVWYNTASEAVISGSIS